MSILITKNTIHQLHLEGKKNVLLPFLLTKISKTKMATGLYINMLAELQLKYYIPLMFN